MKMLDALLRLLTKVEAVLSISERIGRRNRPTWIVPVAAIACAGVMFVSAQHYALQANLQDTWSDWSDADAFTVSASGAITLTGSGFGTKETAAQVYFNTFADADSGDAVEDVGLEIIESSTQNDPNTHIVTNFDHGASHSLFTNYVGDLGGGTHSYFKSVGIDTIGGTYPGIVGTKLYVSYWAYWDTVGAPNIANLKLDRSGGGEPYSGIPKYGVTMVPTSESTIESRCTAGGSTDLFFTDGVPPGHAVPNPPDEARPRCGQWNFTEVIYELSTAGVADGKWIIKYNGGLAVDTTNAVTRTSGVTSLIAWAMGPIDGADRLGGGDIRVWHTDYVFDSSFARVVCTDNETFTSSTDWAVQPISSWSDTEIVILEPNWGTLTGTVYCHVWDEDDTYVDAFEQTVP